ncbi:unnamed protein product [Lathyrus sativus]|nr:unnamed protein product [Lathyrus sativus]
MEKKFEEKLTTMFYQMASFQGGQPSNTLDITLKLDQKVNNMTTDKLSNKRVSTTSQRKLRSNDVKEN